MVRLKYPLELPMFTNIYMMVMMIQVATAISNRYYCSHKRVKIFNENWGTITTRLPWESYYTNNIRCEWTIDAGIANRIRITFIKIDLEQLTPGTSCEDGDFLSIQDGEKKLAPALVKICPGTTNPHEIISRGRHLHLVFKSNRNSFLDYVGIELKFETFDKTGCPPGWGTYGHGHILDYNGGYEYSGACYRVMAKPAGGVDFLTAQRFCSYSQSNLAKVNSSIIFDFLQDLTTTHGLIFNLWVGLTDKKEEGTFQWLDGSHFSSIISVSSSSGSLNDKRRNCIVMNFQPKTFKIVSCDEHHFFICELNLGQSNIYSVPAEVSEGEHNGEDHYVMDAKDFIWIIIAAIATVFPIVLCVVLKVNRSKTINTDYSSGHVECERSIRVQDRCLHQREQDIEATEACLVQPSAQQPPVEPLPNPGPVSEPSAPPLSELQPVIGPPSYDQDAPPSYWEAVYT